ncbi:MAG: DUF4241 domain-containing protein, partial [Coriobacteriaceae bacterium]|nr:DUF4241 domain-containing protein [Coriobacteriaceae bacterium]
MSKATYGALLFAPEREVAKRAVLDQFSTIAENISAPIQNKKGDETYGVRLRGGVDVSIRVFGKKKTASYIAGMKHLYKAASWNNEYLYGRIMYRIESCVGVVECDYKAKSSHKTSNTYEPFSPQGAFDAEELEASVTKALMAAARETDGLVRLPNLEIRNGSNDLVFNLEGKNEQYSESRPDELNDYFATDKALGQRLVKMSLGKLSLPTGEIIACDPFVFLDDAQPFVHRVTPGTYEVEAAVI